MLPDPRHYATFAGSTDERSKVPRKLLRSGRLVRPPYRALRDGRLLLISGTLPAFFWPGGVSDAAGFRVILMLFLSASRCPPQASLQQLVRGMVLGPPLCGFPCEHRLQFRTVFVLEFLRRERRFQGLPESPRRSNSFAPTAATSVRNSFSDRISST